ncbi:hypothetical protein AGMMS49982_09880 [Bacteroidia bacterium]|nr:hypothetical protein AGMMS49982_09880 [Bacteroidia bacterium]
MLKLSKKIKLEIYNLLKKEENAFGYSDEEGIIPFLTDIWDLSSMKSEDNRFNNALGDFVQHTVRNPDDYSLDYVFQERLKLLDDDEKFSKFIETVLLSKYRNGEDDIVRYVLLIAPYLKKEGYTLLSQGYDNDGYPIYKIEVIPQNAAAPPPNDIIFYLEKNPTGSNLHINSHNRPPTYPSFVLVFNDGWNDFSVWSSYCLFYYENDNDSPICVGKVKIIYRTEDITNQYLLDKFTSLDDNFCSLGQEYRYYENLKEIFNKKFKSVLYALRDAAFFPDIQDSFELNTNFKNSLIRTDEAERLLRIAQYKIYGFDLSNLFSFKYIFRPVYSNDSIDVNFEFTPKLPVPSRIYAVIGKNGTGKTQLITSLPLMISRKKDESFTPRTPFFSKIIAVSYSVFDKFEIPERTSDFNYCYCGIRKENNERLSEEELAIRFNEACIKIRELERINKWRKILLTFITEELINLFLIEKDETEITSFRNRYNVDMKSFNDMRNKLSSGQAIILYIITEIVANIRYDSLLLYDEPETHLHPNAITQLMNTIYELVEEFQSYCIIATHSPFIVRELFSKNVYVLEREDTSPSIRRIPLESFGENLSVLSEEIFGNKGIPKQHTKILKRLVDSNKSYEDIVSLLEFDEIPLSLNARIFIKSMINQRDKKSE